MADRLPDLFSRDLRGNIRVWSVWTEGPDVVVEHGLEQGAKVQQRRRADPTNDGRSNARSPAEQAIFEAAAAWTKRCKLGYFDTREAALASEVLLPMLAHPRVEQCVRGNGERYSYTREVLFPIYAQRKYNGLRALARRVGDAIELTSKIGTTWRTLVHIERELLVLMDDGMVLDGEVYRHNTPLQRLNSYIKVWQPQTMELQFFVFDMPSHDGVFGERLAALKELFSANPQLRSVVSVPTWVIQSEDQLTADALQAIQEQYEGLILRKDAPYVFRHRVDHLLKIKNFIDAEFMVQDMLPRLYFPPAGGEPFTICDKCVCAGHYGNGSFEVVPRGTAEDRRTYWEDRECYIGTRMVVRFPEYSESGVPQGNPVGVAFRLDDELYEEDELDPFSSETE